MKKPVPKKISRDTHIYMDAQTWVQLEEIAIEEDRSITATVRVLLKEAMASRRRITEASVRRRH